MKFQKNPSFIQACFAIFSIFHCSEQLQTLSIPGTAPLPGRVSRPSPTSEEKRAACGRQMRGGREKRAGVPGIDLGGSGTWLGRRETGEMKSGSQSRISRDTEPGKHQFSWRIVSVLLRFAPSAPGSPPRPNHSPAPRHVSLPLLAHLPPTRHTLFLIPPPHTKNGPARNRFFHLITHFLAASAPDYSP